MNNLKKTMLNAISEAGKISLEFFNKKKQVNFKSEIDPVTEVDLKTEKKIIEIIRKNFPNHNILTEETIQKQTSSPYKWILDPIDGTVNYYHNYPIFSISIGLEYNNEIIMGAVYAPYLRELFFSEKGKGAFLNDEKINTSNEKTLSRSLLCTGFPYDVKTTKENNLNYFSAFIKQAQAVRRDGSAALDLCYIACGRFDGFWEMSLKPWDIAGASIIIKEAGGIISNFDLQEFSIYNGKIIASNQYIYKDMVRIINNQFN